MHVWWTQQMSPNQLTLGENVFILAHKIKSFRFPRALWKEKKNLHLCKHRGEPSVSSFFWRHFSFNVRWTNVNSTFTQPPWTQISIYSFVRRPWPIWWHVFAVRCVRLSPWKKLHDLTLPLSANINTIIFNLYPLRSAGKMIGQTAASNRLRFFCRAKSVRSESAQKFFHLLLNNSLNNKSEDKR